MTASAGTPLPVRQTLRNSVQKFDFGGEIMRKIGIFGGSFDPPHVGHIQAACAAKEALGLDTVLLIPASAAPHKRGHCATAAQRLEMLELACRHAPGLEASALEIDRGGISYTCDTVAQLRREEPQAQLYLLMGGDMLPSLTQWRNWEEILGQTTLAVFDRNGERENAAVAEQIGQLCARGYRAVQLPCAPMDISSTQLRRMLVFDCAAEFLDAAVLRYIRENGLYGTARDYKNLSEQELEQVVVSLLDPNRVNHVRGCRDAAVELAKRWGADVTDAARAGLLHDVTKALDGRLQLTLCRSYGKILDSFSCRYPKTLHALTGSLVAQRIFGENARVVSAIECHTTGKAAMNLLETILYVADYMEPNRDFPGVEELRRLTTVDMTAALKYGLEMTLAHLQEQGAEVSPASAEALHDLNII